MELELFVCGLLFWFGFNYYIFLKSRYISAVGVYHPNQRIWGAIESKESFDDLARNTASKAAL